MALLNARKKWKEEQRAAITITTLTRERSPPSESAAMTNVNTFGDGLDTTLNNEAASSSDPREGVGRENVKREIVSEGRVTIGQRTSSTRRLDQIGRVQIKTEVTTSEL